MAVPALMPLAMQGAHLSKVADALRQQAQPVPAPPPAVQQPQGAPPAGTPPSRLPPSSVPPPPGPQAAPAAPPAGPPPGNGGCTLILCNLDPSVREGEVLRAAEAQGRLVGSSFQRAAERATLIFARPPDAARAAQALHGRLLGRRVLQVEWGGGGAPGGGATPARGGVSGPPPATLTPQAPPPAGSAGGAHPTGSGSAPPPPRSSRWEREWQPDSGSTPSTSGRGWAEAAPPAAGAAARPPPGYAAQQQQQQQARGAGGGGGNAPPAPPPWVGRVQKGTIGPFRLLCRGPGTRPGAGPPPGLLPPGWIEELHVRERVAVPVVLGMWHARDSRQRGAWRLVPAASEDGAALAALGRYLDEKQRAGVVELPAVGPVPARRLYLLTPSEGLCRELLLAWQPAQMLLAVVLTKQ